MSDFKRWTLVGDFVDGTLLGTVGTYNAYQISHDFGASWDTTKYWFNGVIFRGAEAGELYNYYADFSGASVTYLIQRSSDNGISYDLPKSVPYFYQVTSGSQPGDLYGFMDFTWWHSNDYGLSFESFPIDSSQIKYYSCHTNIIPGVQQGEVYMVSFDQGIRFYIYHSIDYGKTFAMKFESDSINPIDINNLYFFSGTESGEFYWVYEKPNPVPYSHSDLYINYSIDHGQTFTTFFHDLSQYTLGVEKAVKSSSTEFQIIPVPVTDRLDIVFDEDFMSHAEVSIINATGTTVRHYPEFNKQKISLTDLDGLEKGLYFIRVLIDNKYFSTKKFIK
jgi:hypothetical protein